MGLLVSHGQLGFQVRGREVVGNAHDFARALHLGSQHGIGAGEAAERHNSFLRAEMSEGAVIGGQVHVCQLFARHDARGNLCQGHAGRLRHERYRAACARVCLDYVNDLVFNSKLNVEQAAYAQTERQTTCDVAQLGLHVLAQRERRNAASGVARVDARHFDVLQNTAHVNGLSIAQAVQVKLNGIFQEAVKIYGVIGGNFRSLRHVRAQLIGVVDNAHAASAQHETGAYQKRETQTLRHFAGLFERACHAGGGIRYF